jgi:hypothetical protein
MSKPMVFGGIGWDSWDCKVYDVSFGRYLGTSVPMHAIEKFIGLELEFWR